jgi:hypothetical protein
MHIQKPSTPPQLSIYRPETDLKSRYQAIHRELLDHLERGMAAENYWLIFLLLGWELMLTCAFSHYLVEVVKLQSPRWAYLVLWSVHLLISVATMRVIEARSKAEESSYGTLVSRLGAIFIILCWNIVGLNVLMGSPVFALLPVLATLSSFFFLTLAALFTPKFVAAALLLFATGTGIALYPHYGFLIYGAGWLVVLETMAVIFRRRQRRWLLRPSPNVGHPEGEEAIEV